MSIYRFGSVARGECTAFLGILFSLFGIFVVAGNRADGFFHCGGIGEASLGYTLWSTCVFVVILFRACCGDAPTWHKAWQTAATTLSAYTFSFVLGCVIVVAGLVARIFSRDTCIVGRDIDYDGFVIFTACFVAIHMLGIHECRVSLETLQQERPKNLDAAPKAVEAV